MTAFAFRAGLIITVLLGWLIITAPTALAHKVSIFAWVEAGQVHTESKFSGGKKVKAGKIEVFDHEENKVLEGATDAQGHFSFPVPSKATSLNIVLKAGMGHGNHWIITAQELGAAGPATTPEEMDGTEPEANSPMAENGDSLSDQTVQRIVGRVMDQKLAPIKAHMEDQAWGLRDILGGLGYILGLVGLASYLQNRKQRSAK